VRTLAAHLTSGGGTVNEPPVAVTSAEPTSGLAPLTVNLSSAGSHDPDGTIVSYLWNFGDSTYPPEQTEANPVHTYTQTGPLTYHAVLQVVDDRGAASTSSVTINIDTPVHVESQLVTRATQGSDWVGEDVVAIAAPNGVPIAGATVTASYSGPTGGIVSGTTDTEGVVTLRTTSAGTAPSEWCFTVTEVDRDGTGYTPGSNAVTTQCETSEPVDVPSRRLPASLELAAGPNPFDGVATIHFNLPMAATVSVRVLDAAGRLVRDLLHGNLPAGGHDVPWDGRDARGALSPAGVYFVQGSAGDELRTVRLLRLR
jgi:PKD repeat protein